MRIINRDLNLCLSDEPVPDRTRAQFRPPLPENKRSAPLPYNYQAKNFFDGELKWWYQYGIDAATLYRYGVLSLAEYRGVSNSGRTYTLHSSLSEPMFGYVRPGSIKICRPKSRARFFYGGDFKNYYCFGLEQLPATGETLYITGGEKDVLSLAAHGFPAICFGSETVRVPQDLIGQLSKRFNQIVILYDMDDTGVKHSIALKNELCNYNVERMELPLAGTKQDEDISDFFRRGFTADDFRRLKLPRPEVKSYSHKNLICKPKNQ